MKIISILFVMTAIFCFPLFSEMNEVTFSDSQIERGRKLFSEMSAAIGDVSNLKNVRTVGKIQQWFKYGFISFNVYVTAVFPDKIKIKFQDKEYIINNNKGWRRYPKGYFENMPQKLVGFISVNLSRNIIKIIKRREDYRIIDLGSKKVRKTDCDVLLLMNKDYQMKLLLDKKSHLPKQMIYRNRESDEPEIFYRDIEEFREIDGIKYPMHTITYDENEQKICEIKLQSVEFNVSINEDDF